MKLFKVCLILSWVYEKYCTMKLSCMSCAYFFRFMIYPVKLKSVLQSKITNSFRRLKYCDWGLSPKYNNKALNELKSAARAKTR